MYQLNINQLLNLRSKSKKNNKNEKKKKSKIYKTSSSSDSEDGKEDLRSNKSQNHPQIRPGSSRIKCSWNDNGNKETPAIKVKLREHNN